MSYERYYKNWPNQRYPSIADRGARIIVNPQSDSEVCDGYSCYSSASYRVHVKVGKGRTISLSLCENCKTKFEEYGVTQQGNKIIIEKHEGDMNENKGCHNGGKIIKSLQSAQVGARGQIAGVLNISVGADMRR